LRAITYTHHGHLRVFVVVINQHLHRVYVFCAADRPEKVEGKLSKVNGRLNGLGAEKGRNSKCRFRI